MDLLRYVLSRQPLEKVEPFNPSRQFYRLRKQVVVPEAEEIPEVSAVELFQLYGELTEAPSEIIDNYAAKILAIFWQRLDLYEIYSKRENDKFFLSFSCIKLPNHYEMVPIRLYLTSSFFCNYAARKGKLNLLKWAHSRGYPIDESIYAHVGFSGNLTILKWLMTAGYPYSSNASLFAAREGHLEFLRFCITIEGQPHVNHSAGAAGKKQKKVLKWLRKNGTIHPHIFSFAAQSADLEFFKWVVSKFSGSKEHVCGIIAHSGNLEMLKWAYAEGFPFHNSDSQPAAESGNLEMLIWLKEKGVSFNSYTFAYAAKSGNIEMMKWLKNEGCAFDSLSCDYAAKFGKLEALKWLKEIGCQLTETVCTEAVMHGHLDVLKWAIANDCPYRPSLCLELLLRFSEESDQILVIDWITQSGKQKFPQLLQATNKVVRQYVYSYHLDE